PALNTAQDSTPPTPTTAPPIANSISIIIPKWRSQSFSLPPLQKVQDTAEHSFGIIEIRAYLVWATYLAALTEIPHLLFLTNNLLHRLRFINLFQRSIGSV